MQLILAHFLVRRLWCLGRMLLLLKNWLCLCYLWMYQGDISLANYLIWWFVHPDQPRQFKSVVNINSVTINLSKLIVVGSHVNLVFELYGMSTFWYPLVMFIFIGNFVFILYVCTLNPFYSTLTLFLSLFCLL